MGTINVGADGCVMATLAIPSDAIRVVAAPPDTLTQHNVEAVTGLPPRIYLEVIRTPTFPLRVAKLGKLRIVNRAAFVQWLEAGEPEQTDGAAFATHANEVSTAENTKAMIHGANELLASVGLREREPKRRPRRKRYWGRGPCRED